MPSRSSPCKRARPLLGTLVEITAYGPDPAHTQAAIAAAFAVIAEVHARMSAHEAGSDLAALHAAPLGQAVPVSPHTVTVVQAALRLAVQSAGAFNPCLGGRMARWGYLSAHSGKASEDYHALQVQADSLCRHAPLRLDLGGIAKGYAVDCAIAVLQAAGIEQAVVNAGGDLRCYGPDAVPVGLRDPAAPQRIARHIALQNSAMATSAPYFSQRRLRGRSVSALFNPGSQQACTGAFSVSITAPAAMLADALTKVALNAAPPLAAQLLAEYAATAHWLGAPDAP